MAFSHRSILSYQGALGEHHLNVIQFLYEKLSLSTIGCPMMEEDLAFLERRSHEFKGSLKFGALALLILSNYKKDKRFDALNVSRIHQIVSSHETFLKKKLALLIA
jgi:hypothetical protein